ncbi:unnamed protein product [Parnassius apollo]|uniref:(apollo) hypothetical protein n=1 Tax=Parnassius apollo TaxID=110799 RepID=A0A8S3X1G7_PARAO|nr:unnamed protein product [Parnassius apollo]
MPRNWTRKTSKAGWTVSDLQAAAVRIRQGVSMHKVAEKNGIRFSTLQRGIKKYEFKLPKLGRSNSINKQLVVIGPQPSTSDDITNYKPNDSINQENNESYSEPLASKLSQLTPLPCIGKGKCKGKRTRQSGILTATPLITVFKEKAKKRKKKEKHTRGKVIKKIKEVKKNLFKYYFG